MANSNRIDNTPTWYDSDDSDGASKKESRAASALAAASSPPAASPPATKAPPPGPVVVPRNQRRGLLGTLTTVAEVTDPYEYSNKTKWGITFVVAIAGAAGPTASSILFPALIDVSRTLHTPPVIANLSTAFYMLALAIFPLWWSSFSETIGRRTVYIISFTLFTIFTIVCAVSKSIAMLIVFRFLSGGASASVQAVGAGTIADIWAPRERGKAIGIFYLGPLCGPLFAPVIGGALAQKWNWRATQWFLAIYGVIIVILTIFALPETLKNPKSLCNPTISEAQPNPLPLTKTSTRQSAKHHSKRLATIARRLFIDPLTILSYLRFPPVVLTVYYASITFGVLFVLNVSIQQTFSAPPYNFSTLVVGCVYLPSSVGYVLASVLGGRWIDHIMAREARAAGRVRWETPPEGTCGAPREMLDYRPEDRMRENAVLAAALFPAALVWYGWSVERGVFWIVPLIANFFFGIGSMLVFAMVTTMLTEFMPKRASSGIALNNLFRNILSCIGTLAGSPLIDAIGNGWLFTGLGVISGASGGLVIWAMRRYGPRWREDMIQQLAQ